ncbi:hypothetical protein D9Q98_003294 [Chlorella vulgaris]|uniref:Knr4/Smi1-like domain-containing protein n=1 Tax=Chlorella vulgaris TaxID=3077 RepID=A0A9D4TSH8_CHLVU|nr:hypothetical protein D9Q98_003294 [Chlorella vulgaris]
MAGEAEDVLEPGGCFKVVLPHGGQDHVPPQHSAEYGTLMRTVLAPAQQPLEGLGSLSHSVVAVILQHLQGAGGGAATRDVVHLAFSSRALFEAVAAAEPLWQQQCHRLGWSLEWLATLPPGTSSWRYFCGRMALRRRLRCQLSSLARFLDPLSAAAIQRPAAVEQIREVERALQAPLPWELFELYRWCDGQAAERGGVHFLHAARLLSLRELLAAVQERHGPLQTKAAFAQLVRQQSSAHGGSSSAALQPGSSRQAGGWAGEDDAPGCSCSPHAPQGAAAVPQVLLPFTEELRGRKWYCLDTSGRVWLTSGFNTLPVADNLSACILRVLT